VSEFCIKDNYKINDVNITKDEISNNSYWDESRIYSAEMYQFPVYKFLAKFIKNNNIGSIIDIGCGVARKLDYLHKVIPELSIIGIDQPDPINFCKNNYDFGKWYSDDFENTNLGLEIKSKLVISVDVIEHLINPDHLLDYVKQKLDFDGHVLISTPERDSLWGVDCDHSPNKFHVREWNFDELERYLDSKGFEIIDHFLQYPVKITLNKIFYKEIISRALRFKPLKYNQVVIAKVKK